MRESVLGDLARQAATDPEFLRQARRDPAGTLARYRYQLTAGEMWRAEDGEEHTPVPTRSDREDKNEGKRPLTLRIGSRAG